MSIRECIVDAHILEVPLDMGFEETFHLLVIELGVNKDCSNVRFDNIWKYLYRLSGFLIMNSNEDLPLGEPLL